ncbi:MAG: Hpt domain-containing protein [Pseudomonadota bacterium]|mgnify:CR=1 FL=1
MAEPARELDPDALKKLAEIIGHDGAIEIVQTFRADIQNRLTEFKTGLQQGDLKLVERAAHTLKSGSAYVGGHSFAGLCQTLETAASESRTEILLEKQHEFEQRLLRISAELLALESGANS